MGMFSLNAFIFLPGYSVLLLLHGVHILINEKILNIKIEFHQEKFVLSFNFAIVLESENNN